MVSKPARRIWDTQWEENQAGFSGLRRQRTQHCGAGREIVVFQQTKRKSSLEPLWPEFLTIEFPTQSDFRPESFSGHCSAAVTVARSLPAVVRLTRHHPVEPIGLSQGEQAHQAGQSDAVPEHEPQDLSFVAGLLGCHG